MLMWLSPCVSHVRGIIYCGATAIPGNIVAIQGHERFLSSRQAIVQSKFRPGCWLWYFPRRLLTLSHIKAVFRQLLESIELESCDALEVEHLTKFI